MRLIFLPLLLLFVNFVNAQQLMDNGRMATTTDQAEGTTPAVVLSLSDNSVCDGETVTALAEITAKQLAVSSAAGNSNAGIMFDVTALLPGKIKGFQVNLVSGPANFEVYYKTGTHVGFETNSAAWTLAGSSTGIAMGNPVDIGVNLNLDIVAGQTLAFYVTCSSPNVIAYSNGSATGTVSAADDYLQVKEGTGKAYPFGTSNANRIFNGTVYYEPGVSSITWSNGATGFSTNITPTEGTVVAADITFANGSTFSAYRAINHVDPSVVATATPASINPGQSSALSATASVRRSLISVFDAGNGQDGAMFDLDATSALTIKDFSLSIEGDPANLEIYYKTGTHVGFETNAGAWTLLASSSNRPVGKCVPANFNLSLNMVAGQTMAFYITRSDGLGALSYTNGFTLGAALFSDQHLSIKEGQGKEYPFGITFTPRNLNTIVHYEVASPTYATFAWSAGGASANINVSPAVTSSYNVTSTMLGCPATATVTVTVVPAVGVEVFDAAYALKVFPNPASDMLFVNMDQLEGQDIVLNLMDVNGRVVASQVYQNQQGALNSSFELANLSNGTYMLNITDGQQSNSYRVVVMK